MSDLKITVPDMGDFKDVEIIEVLVKEGQTINKNDSLITLESDKSSVEVPSTQSGTINKINVKVGDKVTEGQKLAIVEAMKMQHEIFVSRLSLIACAAPVAIFMFAATTPLAPSIPTLASAMCIDPPLPLHIPPRLPNNSSIIASGSAPFARVCPWPLCVLSRKSSFIKFLQTPDAIASCPIDKWIAPRTSLS